MTILRDYNEVKCKKKNQQIEIFRLIQFHKKVDSREKRSKGEWRMPWLRQAKKDAVSCENVRGSANRT